MRFILNSIDNIQRAEAPESLRERLLSLKKKAEVRVVAMPPRQRWAIAASIALIICLNMAAMLQSPVSLNNSRNASSNAVTEAYFSHITQ